GGGDDCGRVPGEGVGVVPGVPPDDDEGGVRALPEVGHQAGGGADDDGSVHPVGPGTEGAAQPGGPELQRPGEAVGEVGDGGGVTPFGGGEDLGQLRAGHRVRVVGGPLAGAHDEVVGD